MKEGWALVNIWLSQTGRTKGHVSLQVLDNEGHEVFYISIYPKAGATPRQQDIHGVEMDIYTVLGSDHEEEYHLRGRQPVCLPPFRVKNIEEMKDELDSLNLEKCHFAYPASVALFRKKVTLIGKKYNTWNCAALTVHLLKIGEVYLGERTWKRKSTASAFAVGTLFFGSGLTLWVRRLIYAQSFNQMLDCYLKPLDQAVNHNEVKSIVKTGTIMGIAAILAGFSLTPTVSFFGSYTIWEPATPEDVKSSIEKKIANHKIETQDNATEARPSLK